MIIKKIEHIYQNIHLKEISCMFTIRKQYVLQYVKKYKQYVKYKSIQKYKQYVKYKYIKKYKQYVKKKNVLH